MEQSVYEQYLFMDLNASDKSAVKLNFTNRCKECGEEDNLISDHEFVGHLVCQCGHVRNDLLFLDTRPKFRGNTKDDDMIKDECLDAFIDPTLPKSSMSVMMSHGGQPIFQTLRRLQNGYLSSEERSTLSIMDTIRTHTDGFGYPASISHDAAILFRKLQERSKELGDCTRGDVRRALIASCVFHSCRAVHVVKTQEEVAHVFDLTPEQFTKGWSRFIDICAHRGFTDLSLPPLTARDLLFRYTQLLQLPWNLCQLSLQVADHVNRHQWSSNNTPSSVAGAILLTLSKERARLSIFPAFVMVTQAEWDLLESKIQVTTLANICSMSVITLQKITKELLFQWKGAETDMDIEPEEITTTVSSSRRHSKKRARMMGVPSLSSGSSLSSQV
jgi:transcription initiation factor TFIIIB Brf1 subunit/transcription initiation factor TFIIB